MDDPAAQSRSSNNKLLLLPPVRPPPSCSRPDGYLAVVVGGGGRRASVSFDWSIDLFFFPLLLPGQGNRACARCRCRRREHMGERTGGRSRPTLNRGVTLGRELQKERFAGFPGKVWPWNNQAGPSAQLMQVIHVGILHSDKQQAIGRNDVEAVPSIRDLDVDGVG
jgi:hypothetical protein